MMFTDADERTEKMCGSCRRILPADRKHFYLRRRSVDGLQTWCQACQRDYTKAWYEANRQRQLEWWRAYREEHRAAINQRRRKERV